MAAENPRTLEGMKVPDGLSAMYLPELSDRDDWGDKKPAKPEDILARANQFLASLNQAGVDIKAVIPVEVDGGERPGVVGTVKETKHLVIVKK